MAQPQPHPPAVAFSPPQASPSPAQSQPGFIFPVNKRPRLSPGPASQPGSPYPTSPYLASPGASVTPTSTASPQFQEVALPTTNQAATPYTNGHSTPTLKLPEARPQPQPPQSILPAYSPATASPQLPALPTSQPSIPSPNFQYTNARLSPIPTPMQKTVASPVTPGVMGPPSRPPEKPTKEYEYDVTDSLAGTGIDIRAEEQYMADLYSLEGPEARPGHQYHTPGPKASFYGAGPLNQQNQPPPGDTEDQNRLAAAAAEQAWREAAMRLAYNKVQELNDPFLTMSQTHYRLNKIATDQGISLNLGAKNPTQTANRGGRIAGDFPEPRVIVSTRTLPDSTVVQTTGSWIPHDSSLVDQLALLSIAAKHRVRVLLEDAVRAAVNRQQSSHGDIPEEWAIAAATLKPTKSVSELMDLSAPSGETGAEPINSNNKRPLEGDGTADGPPQKLAKVSTNSTILTTRDVARMDRDWEERRLRMRNLRKEGTAESGGVTSRAGSVAPGTPGSIAPDSDKPVAKKDSLTKKEQRKKAAATAAEASSHASQNLTSSMFAGLGSVGGLFGKKKKGKSYDWMNAGRGGSGTATPSRSGTPGPGKPGAAAPVAAASMALTTDGRNRLGTWREDKEKGKNVQLRDWVVALEENGQESRTLMSAYDALDSSNPK